MTLTFEREIRRQTELTNDRLKEQFKLARPPIPTVLCDIQGRFDDGSGNTYDASVPGRPGYVYHRTFAEGAPSEILSIRGVEPISGTPCWAGYAEDSTEIEILFEFIIDKESSTTIEDLRAAQKPTYTYTRDLIPLRCTPLSGLTVRVDPFIYYDGTTRIKFLSDTVILTAPGAGLKRYTLVYLDTATNTIMTSNGSTVPNIGSIDAPLVDPPDGCYPSAWVQVAYGQTTVDRDRDIVDARWYLNRVSENDTSEDIIRMRVFS